MGTTVFNFGEEFELHLLFTLNIMLFLNISYLVSMNFMSANFIKDKNIEQPVCFKFCVDNGISCSECLQVLQKCYGESTV